MQKDSDAIRQLTAFALRQPVDSIELTGIGPAIMAHRFADAKIACEPAIKHADDGNCTRR
jgi:hypothetical protein